MYLIRRLWVDVSENIASKAYGYSAIGIVSTKEDSDRITESTQIPKVRHYYPLAYVKEFRGDTVPLFVSEKLKNLDGFSIKKLKEIEYAALH